MILVSIYGFYFLNNNNIKKSYIIIKKMVLNEFLFVNIVNNYLYMQDVNNEIRKYDNAILMIDINDISRYTNEKEINICYCNNNHEILINKPPIELINIIYDKNENIFLYLLDNIFSDITIDLIRRKHDFYNQYTKKINDYNYEFIIKFLIKNNLIKIHDIQFLIISLITLINDSNEYMPNCCINKDHTQCSCIFYTNYEFINSFKQTIYYIADNFDNNNLFDLLLKMKKINYSNNIKFNFLQKKLLDTTKQINKVLYQYCDFDEENAYYKKTKKL